MIVIGVNTHKSTHTLAAVDAGTGRLLGTRTIDADERGMLAVLRWAQALAGERVWRSTTAGRSPGASSEP